MKMKTKPRISDPGDIMEKGLSQIRIPDADIKVPSGLEDMIERTVDNELGCRRSRLRLVASVSSVAAAAAIAAIALTIPAGGRYEPADTFNDPRQAYAEAVRALEMVGSGLNRGLSKTEAKVSGVMEPVDRVMKKYGNNEKENEN